MLGSLKNLGVPMGACALLLPGAALAGFDTPGSMDFEYYANEEHVYRSHEDLPVDAGFSPGRAKAFFSSDASSFGENGVQIWSGFPLTAPDGPRGGTLLLDLDLAAAPISAEADAPMLRGTVRASYWEQRGDEQVFDGVAIAGNVWVLDAFVPDTEDGALRLEFALIFADGGGTWPGCRVIVGTLKTKATPGRERNEHGMGSDRHYGSTTEIETGCEGNVVVEESYDTSGCESDEPDYDDPGCEGDTHDSDTGCGGDEHHEYDSGCEGDSDSGSDCSGDDDSFDCAGDSGGYSDSSSCEGDTFGGGSDSGGCDSGDSDSGACSDTADAAVPHGRLRKRGRPLRALMRFLPEIVGILFIARLKRRYRPGRSRARR